MSVPFPRRADPEEVVGTAWCPDAIPRDVDVLEEVHRWCLTALTGPELPVFGSPAWCALPDGPTKTHAAVLAALAWWTEHWARADAAAAADVATSHAISAAEDWRMVARDLRARRNSYIPREQ